MPGSRPVALACVAGAVVGALAGCAPPPPRVVSTPPGQTDILIEPRLAEPFTLRRARVALDGEIVYERLFEDGVPESVLVWRAPLSPGEHTVQIELDVIVQCGVSGALRAAYTIHAARVLEVTSEQGGSLAVDLHTRGVMRDFGERIEVGYRSGGSMREHVLDRLPGRFRSPERCPGRVSTDRAVCRAEAAVAEARRERDVVRLLCASTKLGEMHALLAQEATPEASSKVIALGMEADDCVGQLPAVLENYVESRATCPDDR